MKKAQGRRSSTPTSRPTTSRSWSASSRRPSRSAPATTSPTTRASSSGAPSRPSSAPGTTTAPSPTAGCTASPTTGARRSTCRSMVYGNTGDDSGTGVAFTRNPATGENVFYGEFLVNAQGEDVVAGVRTPRPVDRAQRTSGPTSTTSSWRCARRSSTSCATCRTSSSPIEKGRLFMLQTRNGKRTGLAAIRIAVDMADEGLISAGRGAHAHRARAAQPAAAADLLARRQGSAPSRRAGSWPRACPPAPAPPPAGSSSTPTTPCAWAGARRAGHARPRLHEPRGHPRHGAPPRASSPQQGGMTSHAALVARQMGKVCIVGCGELDIDYAARTFTAGGTDGQGRRLDLHRRLHRRGHRRPARDAPARGAAGAAREDAHEARGVASRTSYYAEIMEWADEQRKLLRAHQRRPARPGRQRHRLRRPGHRPLPHRAHVLRRRAHHRPCAR